VPYAIVALLVTVTAVAYAIQEPDPTDPAFLSPGSTADIGGATLATRLRERRIAIERHARTPDALVSARRGNATLFVPAPDLMHSHYLRMLRLMPATTTVVLVRPSQRTLDRGSLDARVFGQAWAAKAVPPGCTHPVATAAGRAAVLRSRYASRSDPVTDRCYASGLVIATLQATRLVLAGANDPFRNDRIDEHGNSALAVGLLAGAHRVVWLDVHKPEPGPEFTGRVDPDPEAGSVGPGGPGPGGPVAGDPDPEGRSPAEDSGPSLFDLFPAAAWAVLALVLLAALLAAVARSRRLGAPVPEPLPVLVPSTETVTGRGRLYQRSRDRGAALAVLRVAARERLAKLLDQPADVPGLTLAAAVAAHTGDDPETVHDLLYGPAPQSDEELVASAAALEELIGAVTQVPTGGSHERSREATGLDHHGLDHDAG
jgi:hypothetical protein